MSKETALINLIHHLVRKIPDLVAYPSKHLFGIYNTTLKRKKDKREKQTDFVFIDHE